ncbi:MAG TPA: NAD(P)H-hydrate dehydratase [Bacteroidales bacterium]|nr:NAD(P)H-hydrate dehydratase [Bacteroidales bacterium]
MKIFPVEKIRDADAHTIANEPIASVDLMERAARQCYRWIKKHVGCSYPIRVFCAPGNNGGDGLVVARLLAQKGYQVQVHLVRVTDKSSADFTTNLERLQEIPKVAISEISDGNNFPEIAPDEVVIDAIFGSGLSRPVEGFTARLIHHINESGAIIIAIDMPSGLFADKPSTAKDASIVRADYTLSFQFPKQAFFYPENESYVGQWGIFDIGLSADFIASAPTNNFYIQKSDIQPLLMPRHKFAHKGTFGHGLLIAGGYGKMGAAVMAAEAALRAGAGLVTAHIPGAGYQIIQTALPECMTSIDADEHNFTVLPEHLENYQAIAAGPGLGKKPETQKALKLLIQNTPVPLLLDADALNILSENKTWLAFLPPESILTPHPKEFERLIGKTKNGFERHEIQRDFSIKNKVFVVLKGGYTCISTPDGRCFFNSTGNAGMGTGGTGDVLTGVLLGLLAQCYPTLHACLLGVYLHGLAGDIAARKLSMQAMIAGDVTKYLGKAYKKTQDAS